MFKLVQHTQLKHCLLDTGYIHVTMEMKQQKTNWKIKKNVYSIINHTSLICFLLVILTEHVHESLVHQWALRHNQRQRSVIKTVNEMRHMKSNFYSYVGREHLKIAKKND